MDMEMNMDNSICGSMERPAKLQFLGVALEQLFSCYCPEKAGSTLNNSNHFVLSYIHTCKGNSFTSITSEE